MGRKCIYLILNLTAFKKTFIITNYEKNISYWNFWTRRSLFIKKITNNLDNFSYNIIIANIHELHKFINTEINNDYKKDTLIENYKKILITLNPIIPHFASEALKNINCIDNVSWPTYDQDLLKEETKPFVIQINGKKRGLIEIKLDQSEKDILNLVYQDNNLSKYLNEKEIKKKIFVPNKLMNIII